MIPVEAVSAAFIALYERDHVGGVGSADIRRALEAAAPHMAAAVLDEAADRAVEQEIECITPAMLRRRAKSYRTAK